ncbi:MAG: winged helix-turn-helix transcriptional regulator [Candidatus Helarchaeota archaeon]|nr:winged helix-turn-helix transcriptional regulator [Candidatus Helarchaeota archaeon]
MISKTNGSEEEYNKDSLRTDLLTNPKFPKLNVDELLENENRSKIFKYILNQPGIHFNELLRRIGISAGTLTWHLAVLEKSMVIQKRRVGQYLFYFSCLEKNPLSRLDQKLSKSKTTLNVLRLINGNPGLYQNQIAKRLNLHHKTIKYHLNKLLNVDAIYKEKTGRHQRFYPVFKIIICGDGGIGKTALSTCFCKQIYHDHDMTVGIDIHIKKVLVNDALEILQIWDLSGQKQFEFLLPDFFRGGHGVILGFDVSRRESFLNLNKWLKIIPQVPIYLIATKTDKGYHPLLNRTIIQDFVKKYNLVGFTETSAKENLNVDVPFIRLIEFIQGLEPGSIPITFTSNVERPKSIGFWLLGKDSELIRIQIGNLEKFLKTEEEIELFASFLEYNSLK